MLKGEKVRVHVFGRSGCARTQRVLSRLVKFVRRKQLPERIELVFFDLETAEGLAEAAYRQLEGEIPAIWVEARRPGPAISGEPPFRDRGGTEADKGVSLVAPSRN